MVNSVVGLYAFEPFVLKIEVVSAVVNSAITNEAKPPSSHENPYGTWSIEEIS